MFNSKNKSKNPVGFVFDTMFDAFLPKKEKSSHKVRKGMITVGVVTAGSAALAALLNRKGES